MTGLLLDAARRYAERHADANGIAGTSLPGLTILRDTKPGALQCAVSRPLVALVLQGAKRVMLGSSTFDFGAGDSLLITADVPTASRITRATLGMPYVALVVELDPAVVADLVTEIGPTPVVAGTPVRVDPTEGEVADAALRLLRLLDRPPSIPVLRDQLVRELHYWLLSGQHGGALRALGIPDSHARRIARAVAIIRAEFAQPLPVERLARAAGMSASAFHQHFREQTSLTPGQFQKQLRLIEARRLMLAKATAIANAAHAVGYESVSQFTREYGRLYGMPPGRDMREVRQQSRSARTRRPFRPERGDIALWPASQQVFGNDPDEVTDLGCIHTAG